MSKIALTPNASGTGTLTIAAPNTNTDRTLTLPDATGTVNISGLANEVPAGSAGAPAIYPTGDTNTGIFFPAADTVAVATAGTERLRVNSAGNLGLGTTSPTHNASAGSVVAHINGPSTNAAVLHLTNETTGSAANDGLILARWNDNTNYLWTYENEAIAFGTNNLERMRIDSAGRVTMPYQPAFSAKHTATEGPGTNSPLTQWGVQVNVGGGAFSNGRYTAPIAGNYLISLSLLQNTGTGSSGVNLTKNGSIIYRVMYAVTGYGYQMASGTYILSLAANDYIEFTNEVGSIQWYGDATGLGAMTVQLIG